MNSQKKMDMKFIDEQEIMLKVVNKLKTFLQTCNDKCWDEITPAHLIIEVKHNGTDIKFDFGNQMNELKRMRQFRPELFFTCKNLYNIFKNFSYTIMKKEVMRVVLNSKNGLIMNNLLEAANFLSIGGTITKIVLAGFSIFGMYTSNVKPFMDYDENLKKIVRGRITHEIMTTNQLRVGLDKNLQMLFTILDIPLEEQKKLQSLPYNNLSKYFQEKSIIMTNERLQKLKEVNVGNGQVNFLRQELLKRYEKRNMNTYNADNVIHMWLGPYCKRWLQSFEKKSILKHRKTKDVFKLCTKRYIVAMVLLKHKLLYCKELHNSFDTKHKKRNGCATISLTDVGIIQIVGRYKNGELFHMKFPSIEIFSRNEKVIVENIHKKVRKGVKFCIYTH